MAGRVVLVDDVITAGTAVRESLIILKENYSQLSGVLIALDRMERGTGTESAIQQIRRECNVPVVAIIDLDCIVEYLELKGEHDKVQIISEYRSQYGISSPN